MNRDDIIRMAHESGVYLRGHYDESGSTPAELARFAALVAAHEREECAKVCDRGADVMPASKAREGAARCAQAIRARSENARRSE